MGLPRFPCTQEQMAKALNDIDKSINKSPVRAQLAEDMTTNSALFDVDNIRPTQPGQSTPSITQAKNIWNLAGHNNDEVLLMWDETEGEYVFQQILHVSLSPMVDAEDTGTDVTGDRQTIRAMTSGSETTFTIVQTEDCE